MTHGPAAVPAAKSPHSSPEAGPSRRALPHGTAAGRRQRRPHCRLMGRCPRPGGIDPMGPPPSRRQRSRTVRLWSGPRPMWAHQSRAVVRASARSPHAGTSRLIQASRTAPYPHTTFPPIASRGFSLPWLRVPVPPAPLSGTGRSQKPLAPRPPAIATRLSPPLSRARGPFSRPSVAGRLAPSFDLATLIYPRPPILRPRGVARSVSSVLSAAIVLHAQAPWRGAVNVAPGAARGKGHHMSMPWKGISTNPLVSPSRMTVEVPLQGTF
jgi:hypothetical protein